MTADAYANPALPSGTASASASGTVKLTIQYDGTTTDKPPTSVTLTFIANMTGHIQFYTFARNPPSGSASGSYSGTVTRLGSVTDTISDSFGPIPQTTTGYGLGYASKNKDLSNQVVPTPISVWTQTPGSGTNVKYTYQVTIATLSASADATCFNHKQSYAQGYWKYEINLDGMTAG